MFKIKSVNVLFVLLGLLSLGITSCSKKAKEAAIENAVKDGVVSGSDLSEIKKQAESEKNQNLTNSGKSILAESEGISSSSSADSTAQVRPNHFIVIAKGGSFAETTSAIESSGGKIIYTDEATGFIHFVSSANFALTLIENKKVSVLSVDRIKTEHPYFAKDEEIKTSSSAAQMDNLFPIKLMKLDELKSTLKARGIDANGSNVTVAVVDTGLDISRTDAFQDRIVGVRGIRTMDSALLTNAEIKDIDGKTFLTAKINDVEVKIERTEKLKTDRKYFIGYFSEKQFKTSNTTYNKYDFNQDGKDDAVFPVLVFKNDEGLFEAYVNVNDAGIYGNKGDRSIEDENKLLDFNLVAEKDPERYVRDANNEILSFYKFTTKLDIAQNGQTTKSRTKGRVMLAINLEPGYELTEDGSDLADSELSTDKQKIYKMGISGFDIMGHGTHCAGIAAGKFTTAMQFSSAATDSKIVGISFLGGGASDSDFFTAVLKTIKRYPNVVFNFSFGGSSEMNDSQSTWAKTLDKIASTYNTAFVKAAGNEGPGFKSHGTNFSNNIIAVASYYNTNSRVVHGTSHSNFEINKNYVSDYSSRGPMVDGALKPDIGAPGWVMSSTPLARGMGVTSDSAFEYWPGTSMATPNVVSTLAVLYDATIKTGIAKNNSKAIENSLPVSIDKMMKAIRNSALSYDSFTKASCKSVSSGGYAGVCNLIEEKHSFNWMEGGAGRINAVGAWEILEQIATMPKTFYSTKTKSFIQGYYKSAVGHLSFDQIPDMIDFTVAMDADVNDLTNLVRNETVILKIPSEIDWLSFDRSIDAKEKTIELMGVAQQSVRVFVNSEKLMKNGKLAPGVHFAAIKGFNTKTSDLFDFVFPVTMIGFDTHFDSITENNHYSVRGFVSAGQFSRHFIPVKTDNTSVVIDLNTSDVNPGDVKMSLYYMGIDLDYKDLGAQSPWAISSADMGEGRGKLRYTISGMKAGLYEVVLTADQASNYSMNGNLGSFYELNAFQMALSEGKTQIIKGAKESKIALDGFVNEGALLRIATAKVLSKAVKSVSNFTVKEKETIDIPITVAAGISALEINTAYLGSLEGMDIDIDLVDKDGKTIASSGGESAQERILTAVTAGVYTLKVNGYAISNKDKQETFELTVKQILENEIVLANSFKGPTKDLILNNTFRWDAGQKYSFSTIIDNSLFDKLPKIENYSPVVAVEITAKIGNEGQKVSVFSKEI